MIQKEARERSPLLRASAYFLVAALGSILLLAAPQHQLRPAAAASLVAAGMTAEDDLGTAPAWVIGAVAALRQGHALATRDAALRAENTTLQDRLAALGALPAENAALRRDLAFERGFSGHLLTVAVIGASADPEHAFLLVDRGTAAGIRPGMPVAGEGELVGTVVAVTAATATVRTIVDPGSRVAGYGSVSGTVGTVAGTGTAVQFLAPATLGPSLRPGEWILTSGLGGLYPRGIPVGRLAKVSRLDSATMETGQLAPATPPETLTAVQVILDFRP